MKESFDRFLPFLASLAVPRKRGRAKVFDEVFASATGKTWKALKEYPARLRRTADEVEHINNSTFLSPTIWFRNGERETRMIRGYFLRLPGILRVYAAWMEQLLVMLQASAKEHFLSGSRGYPRAVFCLSDLVRAFTGRYRDAQVCDLLEATARALGVDYQFDPILLAQARGRRAGKPPIT